MTAGNYKTDNGQTVAAVVVLNANADGTTSAGGIGGTAQIVNPNGITFTAAGGIVTTVTTGGTAVVPFAANSIVHGARIINPSTATEPLFVNMLTAATLVVGGGNELIPPGGTWTAPGPMAGSVSVNATTSGHAFSAVRW